MTREVKWHSQPDAHDYGAAANYLSLVMKPLDARRTVDRLGTVNVSHFLAKDILRASRLALLPTDNRHVAGHLRKIETGLPLSPILLVRGNAHKDHPVIVADGYHRVCASYWTNENTRIPCHIVDLQDATK